MVLRQLGIDNNMFTSAIELPHSKSTLCDWAKVMVVRFRNVYVSGLATKISCPAGRAVLDSVKLEWNLPFRHQWGMNIDSVYVLRDLT